MTSLDRPLKAASAGRTVRPVSYRVEITSEFDAASLRGTNAPTPFQRFFWLGSWYEALAILPGVAPVIVTVHDAQTGDLALVLPLVLRNVGGLRVIEFADLLLTDYNAPLPGPSAPRDRAGAVRMWRAVRRALPRADVIRLAKMEPTLCGRPNPFGLLGGATACALNGNVLPVGDDYEQWRRSGLERDERKQLDRKWRIFTKEPGAVFERITDPARAMVALDALERLQASRMSALRATYFLNEPHVARFYRSVIARGLADGSVVLTALTAGTEFVAVHLGVRHGERSVTIRVGMVGGRWANCSPGRLVIERTMAAMHAEGIRVFDLGIGDYDYKRRFGFTPLPLIDLVAPLSWRGLAPSARARFIGYLRTRPELDRRMRAWLGRFNTFKF